MFAALFSPVPDDAPSLLAAARGFSPRVEPQLGGRLLLIDAAGLGRIIGDAAAIASELRAACEGADAPRAPHVAVAPTRTAALLLAIARPRAVVLAGRTAAAVGALSLDVFDTLAALPIRSNPNRNPSNPSNLSNPSRPCPLCLLCTASHRQARMRCRRPGGACTELPTLRRWGLATLADVAALPPAGVAARLGQVGVALQRLARGVDAQPLVPLVEEARFEASMDLEWPIEQLEPLSFVLTRLLDPLSAALERADRGAAAIVTTLTLVRLKADATDRTRDAHVRRLELPAPMRDARVLRTLILLDLESHPPDAGIDCVAVRLEPTPGRIVQFSLLERAGPQPETIATLVSRLIALMGEGRVGSPAPIDSHRPDAFAISTFRGTECSAECRMPKAEGVKVERVRAEGVLRRFRLPAAARVSLEGGRPVRVTTDRIGIRGGAVEQYAGPWRSSGGWWSACVPRDPGGSPRALNDDAVWDRDEYDVALSDGAAYRIYRDRREDRWFIEGILD
ncbi:MAG TPA: hypothetical protein VK886_07425 [Vicinamibacterales bacterium]|nr:hypothetical protein [Vicinamibacterales bacterium]